MPKKRKGRTLVTVADNHGLRKSVDEVAAAVSDWLPQVLGLIRARSPHLLSPAASASRDGAGG